MARRNNKNTSPKKPRVTLASDSVQILSPLDGSTDVASTFTATGSGSPDNTTVTGVLTDANTGATIPCSPPSTTIVQASWSLSFQNVPAGTYVLAVNQTPPNQGADAVNISIPAVVTVTMDPIASPTGTTATVTGTCSDPTTNMSAFIAASKPKKGNPDKAHGNTYSFTFTGLTIGTIYTVTVSPIRGHGKGARRTFTA